LKKQVAASKPKALGMDENRWTLSFLLSVFEQIDEVPGP